MVMRGGVIIASQIDLSEAVITKQVPETQLTRSARASLTEQDTNASGRYKNRRFSFINQVFKPFSSDTFSVIQINLT